MARAEFNENHVYMLSTGRQTVDETWWVQRRPTCIRAIKPFYGQNYRFFTRHAMATVSIPLPVVPRGSTNLGGTVLSVETPMMPRDRAILLLLILFN